MPALVAILVVILDVDFDVESPPEPAQHPRKLANRFTAAVIPH